MWKSRNKKMEILLQNHQRKKPEEFNNNVYSCLTIFTEEILIKTLLHID